jgi:molybdate transport system ATP-binding protein
MIDVDIEQRLGDFALSVRFASDAPILGIFGASGSGKTSVLNAIAGISRPHGRIRVNDTLLRDSSRRIDVPIHRRRIGYVFQDALLFPHLDVAANLAYGRRLRSGDESMIATERVVDLLGLRGLMHRSPTSLSGGEKQRVAIGRALLSQPRIVLMDEPLASLDIPRKAEILDYIEHVRDALHIPIVYVSHAVAEIARLCDEVATLSGGKCVRVGPVNHVIRDLDSPTGHDDVFTVIETRLKSHEEADHLSVLAFDGGELIVPRVNAMPGERVRARVRARDVSIALRPPTQISVLNVLEAKVIGFDHVAAGMTDVQLGVGHARLVARITRRSNSDLGIEKHHVVFALVTAVSFDEQSVGYV